MQLEQLAAITSSVRKHMQSPTQIEKGLRRIREIGYPAVQISGIGEYDPEWMKALCDDIGLTICATHENSAKIVNDPQAVAEHLRMLDCDITAYPYPHRMFETEEDVLDLAAELDRAGSILRKAGITLAYHNHDIEFVRFGDRTALEILYDATDAANLQGEPDTHWIQRGGGDPVAWCMRLNDRLPVLHMKDYGVNTEREPLMTSIGAGNLNWQAICDAAEEAGCRWYVVEHDGGTFESLANSFRFISQELCE